MLVLGHHDAQTRILDQRDGQGEHGQRSHPECVGIVGAGPQLDEYPSEYGKAGGDQADDEKLQSSHPDKQVAPLLFRGIGDDHTGDPGNQNAGDGGGQLHDDAVEGAAHVINRNGGGAGQHAQDHLVRGPEEHIHQGPQEHEHREAQHLPNQRAGKPGEPGPERS